MQICYSRNNSLLQCYCTLIQNIFLKLISMFSTNKVTLERIKCGRIMTVFLLQYKHLNQMNNTYCEPSIIENKNKKNKAETKCRDCWKSQCVLFIYYSTTINMCFCVFHITHINWYKYIETQGYTTLLLHASDKLIFNEFL